MNYTHIETRQNPQNFEKHIDDGKTSRESVEDVLCNRDNMYSVLN